MVVENVTCTLKDCYFFVLISFLLTFVIIFGLNMILFKRLVRYAKKRYNLEK